MRILHAGADLLQYGVEGGSLDIVNLLLGELEASCSSADIQPDSHISPQTSLAARLSAACSLSTGKKQASQPAEQPEDEEYDPEKVYDYDLDEECHPQDCQHAGGIAGPPAAESGAQGYACNPMHVAALKGFSDLIPSLLGAGFLPDALDACKRTPLHYAAMKGYAFFPAHQPAPQQTPAQTGPSHEAAKSSDSQRAEEQQRPLGGQAEEDQSPRYSTSCSGDSERSSSSQGSLLTTPPTYSIPGAGAITPAPFSPPPYGGFGSMPPGAMNAQMAGGRPPYGHGPPAATQYYGPRATVAYTDTADLLLRAGAAADAIDAWGCTALHYAAGAPKSRLMQALYLPHVPIGLDHK